jgi:hypothetical protein
MGLASDIGRGFGASGPGLLIGGIAGLILGPPILRLAGRIVRPAARTVIRSGADAYRYTREGIGDLMEESRAELVHAESKDAEPKAKSQRPAKPSKRAARAPAKPGGHVGAHP